MFGPACLQMVALAECNFYGALAVVQQALQTGEDMGASACAASGAVGVAPGIERCSRLPSAHAWPPIRRPCLLLSACCAHRSRLGGLLLSGSYSLCLCTLSPMHSLATHALCLSSTIIIKHHHLHPQFAAALPIEELEGAWLGGMRQMAAALPPDHPMVGVAQRELARCEGWPGRVSLAASSAGSRGVCLVAQADTPAFKDL